MLASVMSGGGLAEPPITYLEIGTVADDIVNLHYIDVDGYY